MLQCRIGTLTSVILSTFTLSVAGICADTNSQPGTQTPAGIVDTYRYDNARTGFTTDNVTPPLTLIWKRTITPTPNVLQAPLYKAGILYFAAGKQIQALKASDGSLIWKFEKTQDSSDTDDTDTSKKTDVTFNTPGVLSNDSIFISGSDSYLYRLKLADGSVVWTHKLTAPIKSAPFIYNDHIIAGCEDGSLYSLTTDSGNEAWVYHSGGPIVSPPALTDANLIIFASGDNRLYCVGYDSGTQKWTMPVTANISDCVPVVSGDSVIFGVGRDLMAIAQRRGTVRWRTHFNANVIAAPAVGNGLVVAVTDDNVVHALNDHGNSLWNANINGLSTGGALLTGKSVIVPTLGGTLFAFSKDNGDLQWEYEVQITSTTAKKPKTINLLSEPVLVDGTVYVQSDDGSISAFRSDVVDQIGPIVSDMSPKPGSTVGGKGIPYKGTIIDDGSGVNPSTFKLEIDGAVIAGVVYDPVTNGLKVKKDPDSDKDPIPSLKDGAHKAKITVSDWRNNTTVKNWGFVVDNKIKNTPTKPANPNQPGTGPFGPGRMPGYPGGRPNGPPNGYPFGGNGPYGGGGAPPAPPIGGAD